MGLGDQDFVNLVLGFGVVFRGFADVDQFTGLGGVVKEVGVDEAVVDDYVGALDVFEGLDGDEIRVAGSRACEGYKTDAAHPVTPESNSAAP